MYRNSSIDRLGVFANRNLEPGDIIMVEEPVLVSEGPTMKNLEQFMDFCTDLRCQFDKLDTNTQASFKVTEFFHIFPYQCFSKLPSQTIRLGKNCPSHIDLQPLCQG